jgi:carbon monoxide dehydrogenase subunit G
MKVTQEFEVESPIAKVWELFESVPEVVDCLPGATLLEELGGDRYHGEVAVKIGPISARFDGEAQHFSDPAAYQGGIEGGGADKKGGSRGQVKIDYKLEETGNGTKVSVDSDITLSGRAAQFGRPGLVKEMTSRILTEFGKNLEAKLTAGAPGASAGVSSEGPAAESSVAAPAREISGLGLFFGSLWAAFKNWLSGKSDGSGPSGAA